MAFLLIFAGSPAARGGGLPATALAWASSALTWGGTTITWG